DEAGTVWAGPAGRAPQRGLAAIGPTAFAGWIAARGVAARPAAAAVSAVAVTGASLAGPVAGAVDLTAVVVERGAATLAGRVGDTDR
ncbi:MAG: hypothetical protein ACRDT5_16030, partial [Mycobacterium sp.]